MICAECKSGADLLAQIRAGNPPIVMSWPEGSISRTAETRPLAEAEATDLHGNCKGGTHCPCQHVGTKYHRGAVQ